MKRYRIEFTEADAYTDRTSVLVYEDSKVEALMHVVNSFTVYSVYSVERVEDDE